MKEKLKNHFRKYRIHYSFASIALVSGAAFYIGKKNGNITILTSNSNVIAGGSNSVINQTINHTGRMSKIVRCIETGEVWTSITQAANENKLRLSDLSKHVNGYDGFENVNGLHFELLGTTSGVV